MRMIPRCPTTMTWQKQRKWRRNCVALIESAFAAARNIGRFTGRTKGFVIVCTALLLLSSVPAIAQQTKLVLYAKWDDGTPVLAQVSIAIPNSPPLVTSTNGCCSAGWGWASVTATFSQTTPYQITLTCQAPTGSSQISACPNGTVLYSFPFVFFLIDPSTVPRGELDIEFSKATRAFVGAKPSICVLKCP